MLCIKCPIRKTCNTICPDINKLLKKSRIRSADFIRPEVSKEKRRDGIGRFREYSSEDIDSLATQRAIKLQGRKKSVKKYSEIA